MGCCTRFDRLLLRYDAEASYGAGSTNWATAYRVAARVPDFGSLGEEFQRSEDVTATDTPIKGYNVRRSGSVKTTIDVRGIMLATPDTEYTGSGLIGHAPSDFALAALGSDYGGGFGTVQAGTTTTAVKLASNGEASTFSGGMLMYCQDANGNGMYGRVKSVATDTVTLHWALPAIPATNSLALGGRLLFKSEPQGSLALQMLGDNLDDTRTALGCFPQSLKIMVPPQDRATMELDFFAAAMEGMELDDEHAALTEFSDPYPYPIQGYDGGLWAIPITSGTCGTPIRMQGGWEFDPGIELKPIQGVHGDQPNGVAGTCVIRRSGRITVNGECFRNYTSGGHPVAGEGAYWRDAYRNGTEFAIVASAGGGMNSVCCHLGTAVLVEPPMPSNQDGRSVLNLVFEERPLAITDAGSGDAKSNTMCVLFPAGDITPP